MSCLKGHPQLEVPMQFECWIDNASEQAGAEANVIASPKEKHVIPRTSTAAA
jgi:hypothetical protein